MALGWVYVLSNAVMPGLVKIGQSASDPDLRALGLHTTGVPEAFFVEYKGLFDDYARLERLVHDALHQHRVNRQREFFRLSAATAVGKIRELAKGGPKFEVCNFEAIEPNTTLSQTRTAPAIISPAAEARLLRAERARRKKLQEEGASLSERIGLLNCSKCGSLVRNTQPHCPRCKTPIMVSLPPES